MAQWAKEHEFNLICTTIRASKSRVLSTKPGANPCDLKNQLFANHARGD
jgi:hypothetical protein